VKLCGRVDEAVRCEGGRAAAWWLTLLWESMVSLKLLSSHRRSTLASGSTPLHSGPPGADVLERTPPGVLAPSCWGLGGLWRLVAGLPAAAAAAAAPAPARRSGLRRCVWGSGAKLLGEPAAAAALVVLGRRAAWSRRPPPVRVGLWRP